MANRSAARLFHLDRHSLLSRPCVPAPLSRDVAGEPRREMEIRLFVATGHALVDHRLGDDLACAGVAARAGIGGNAHAVARHDASWREAALLLQEVRDCGGAPGA